MIYNVAITHPAGGEENAIHLLGNSDVQRVLDFLETIKSRIKFTTYCVLCKYVKDFFGKEGEDFFNGSRSNYQRTIIVNDVRIAIIQA